MLSFQRWWKHAKVKLTISLAFLLLFILPYELMQWVPQDDLVLSEGLTRWGDPKLTASQVKKVLIQSGLTPNTNVTVGDPQTTKPFAEISKSGTIVNAYNALILAERMAKGK